MSLNLLSAASALRSVGSILLALLILLLMITVHEFGHYVAGKIFKFKINEFAIGFGPALYKKTKKNGEVFSIRALPLGGYCAFEGENDDDATDASAAGSAPSSDPNAFNNKKPWQRIIVLISGALMNFLTALVCIAISFSAFGQLLFMTYEVAPLSLEEQVEYAGYTFQDRDIILSVEGKDCYLSTDLMKALKGGKKGDVYTFQIIRNGEKVTQQIKLRSAATIDSVTDTNTLFESLGIAQKDGVYQMYSCKAKFGFFESLGRAFVYAFRIAGSIFTVLGQLLTGALGLNAMGGPITTISVTSKLASQGLLQFLEITAYIGVNLAVFNLLPIPALDGSKVVFTTIEWVRGKPVNRKVENALHFAGLFLLFGFAILVDLLHLF
ncbi:MAG: site-2 protease family protein [Clostridia bacterium]|nr:site-2 protease family protein [Clostridia bacterium]MBQ1942490.1 site-2 protease family protein [Clostridia bacterium]